MNEAEKIVIANFCGWLLDNKEGEPAYEETLQGWLAEYIAHKGGETHPDDALVDQFADRAKDKMRRSREKGRHGWNDPVETPASTLVDQLTGHIEKGDPMDVAIFAMMLEIRGDVIEPFDEDAKLATRSDLMCETGRAKVKVVKFSDYSRLRARLKRLQGGES